MGKQVVRKTKLQILSEYPRKVIRNEVFRGIAKYLLFPIFVAVIGGWMFYEVQKNDFLNQKKLSAFENIIDSYNNLSQSLQKRKELLIKKSLNALGNTIISPEHKLQVIVEENELKYKILEYSNALKHNEILLKIYFDYPIDMEITLLTNIYNKLVDTEKYTIEYMLYLDNQAPKLMVANNKHEQESIFKEIETEKLKYNKNIAMAQLVVQSDFSCFQTNMYKIIRNDLHKNIFKKIFFFHNKSVAKLLSEACN